MKPLRRPDAWFDRQLAHARRALAEADRQHTAEEIAAAEAALSVPSDERQSALILPLEARRA